MSTTDAALRLFPASRFAAALGVKPQWAKKLLANATGGQPITVRGQKTVGYPLSGVPPRVYQELISFAARGGFRDVAQMLDDQEEDGGFFVEREPAWRPAIAPENISSRQVKAAKARCEILARLMPRAATESVLGIVRDASVSVILCRELCGAGERTIGIWINRTAERDRGRLEWDRWELYLDDKLVRENPSAGGVTVDASLIYEPIDNFILVLCQGIEAKLIGGDSLQTALREAYGLAKRHPRYAKAKSDTRSKAIRNAWKKYNRHGALPDLRAKYSGRRPLVSLNETEQRIGRHLFVKLESTTQAARMLANDPNCRPEVADAILKPRSSKHTLTPTIREQLEVPSQVVEYYKSPKRARLKNFINPRTLSYIDTAGYERKLTPGDLFERDDMSNNFLCWIPWPWGGDPCSDRYGVRVARGQNLLMIDVASLFFTSFNFLIRARDSYRADDIWQWIVHTYRDIGLPRIGERWERGTWAAKRLRGDQEALIEAGHTDEHARLAGMAALGLRVIESQSPTTKIIENRFNFLQRIMATIPGQIGRKRGEFERATKVWTACKAGYQDPRKHFLGYEECCDKIEESLAYVNAEPVEGYVYSGIPAQLWSDGIEAEPLQKLAEEKGYLFARDRREITAAKCHVLVRHTRDDKSRGAWWFHHPDLYRFEGERIAVYFDRYAVESGATLVCLTGRKSGTVIGHGDLISGCPQFALTNGFSEAGDGLRRRRQMMDAVIGEARTYSAAGRIGRHRLVDDGTGQTIETGTALPISTLSMAAVPLSLDTKKARGRDMISRAREEHERSAARDFEASELNRVEQLEAEALMRGDYLPA